MQIDIHVTGKQTEIIENDDTSTRKLTIICVM